MQVHGGDAAGAAIGEAVRDRVLAAGGTFGPEGLADAPALAVRGVMLDISRGRVPRQETLLAMTERLARFGVNHLELYMEHTFAYPGHEELWRGHDPLSAAELGALAARCRERHVELAPNQNTLGHFERWLELDRYRPLAVSPAGFTDPDGNFRSPSTLDPHLPAARDLVAGLLAELCAVLPDGPVNVGLDEPWELLDGREHEWRAYLLWLRSLPVLAGRELLCWGDVPAAHPELLADFPAGVGVCEWGYEAGHPFAARAERLAAHGVPFWCCPGTSSWNAVAGRLDNALANCREAVDATVRFGGGGVLVTDWGDGACQQSLPFIEAPLALGALLAWDPDALAGRDVGAVISAAVFEDPSGSLGAAVAGLANVYQEISAPMSNASALTRLLFRPQDGVHKKGYETVGATDYRRAARRIEDALGALDGARSARADADLVVAEVRAAGEVLLLCCADGLARLAGDGSASGIAPGKNRALAAEADRLADQHAERWLARNRPGGLEESLGPLRRFAAAHRP